MKKLILSILMLGFAAAPLRAVEPVAYEKGIRTINLEGSLDFEDNNEAVSDLSIGFGYFPFNRVMAKVYVDRADYGSDTSATGLGVGGYYFQPVKGSASVFVGARTGWMYIDTDSGNIDSYYISPRLGVDTLIAPTVALYLQYYFTQQSENVYNNDGDSLDDQDAGLYSGLMVFF